MYEINNRTTVLGFFITARAQSSISFTVWFCFQFFSLSSKLFCCCCRRCYFFFFFFSFLLVHWLVSSFSHLLFLSHSFSLTLSLHVYVCVVLSFACYFGAPFVVVIIVMFLLFVFPNIFFYYLILLLLFFFRFPN